MQMNYLKKFQTDARVNISHFALRSYAQLDRLFMPGNDFMNDTKLLVGMCKERQNYNFIMPVKSGPYSFYKDRMELASTLDVIDCEYFCASVAAYFKYNSRRQPFHVHSMMDLGQAAGRLVFENYASQYYNLNELNVSAFGIANAGDTIGTDLSCQFVVEKGREDLRKHRPVTSVGQLLTPEFDQYKKDNEKNRLLISEAFDRHFGSTKSDESRSEPYVDPGLSGIFETFRLDYTTMTGRRLNQQTVMYSDKERIILLSTALEERKLIPDN